MTVFAGEPSPTSQKGVRIIQLPDRVRIELNGALFTEYFYKDVPRPYFYPLIGPGGKAMTRDWPMKSPPGEEHDHPHHRSLWFAHGSVNGQDFWTEQNGSGKIVHDGFTEISSGERAGIIRSRDKWIAADGTVVCTDDRRLRVQAPGAKDERVFDFEVVLHASNGEVTFGDTKEGTMAVRIAETMRLKGQNGHGQIVNSAGEKNDDTWGKRADWCDYSGPVDGQLVGIAIFDNPKNPRHPTWWHVRDYGLFAANPFGEHDFKKIADKNAGALKIPAGQSVTFRYRFCLHPGDAAQAAVSKKFADYANEAHN